MSDQLAKDQQIAYLSRRSRRRMRQTAVRFATFSLLFTALIIYFALSGLTPQQSEARLSAQPAPHAIEIDPRWVDLPPMNRRLSVHRIEKGDALIDLLTRQNVPASEGHAAIVALRDSFDPRRLMPGQEIRIFWERPNDFTVPERERFAGFEFIPTASQRVVVRRIGAQSYAANRYQRVLTERHFFANTLIENSVYEAARASGIAPSMVIELIRLFSYAVDFQRDIREGDQLEALFTRRFDSENKLGEEGEIIYAALTNKGQRISMWGLEQSDGTMAYYDQNGLSARRLLMKTPVDGARLSSRFGRRRHPILGFTRMHRGLDFAAPPGTPIYAAGDGKISEIGKKGDFGNYIRIQHKNGYQTRYAHMLDFTRGLRRGDEVKQGQIIGRVGSSGLATGPHLHYEVIQNGKHINPRTLNLPAAARLDADGLQRLSQRRGDIELQIKMLSSSPLNQPRIRAELPR